MCDINVLVLTKFDILKIIIIKMIDNRRIQSCNNILIRKIENLIKKDFVIEKLIDIYIK